MLKLTPEQAREAGDILLDISKQILEQSPSDYDRILESFASLLSVKLTLRLTP